MNHLNSRTRNNIASQFGEFVTVSCLEKEIHGERRTIYRIRKPKGTKESLAIIQASGHVEIVKLP